MLQKLLSNVVITVAILSREPQFRLEVCLTLRLSLVHPANSRRVFMCVLARVEHEKNHV